MKGLFYILLYAFTLCSCQQNMERSYFDNGELLLEVPLEKNKRHGWLTQYDSIGNIQLISHWIHGVKEGMISTYHPNGNLQSIGYYKDGLPEGTFHYYDSLGNFERELIAVNKNVVLLEERRTFFPDGRIKHLERLKNYKYDGLQTQFFEDGKLHEKILFQDGELIYFKQYNEDGELTKCILDVEVSLEEASDYCIGESYSVKFTLNSSEIHPDTLVTAVIIGTLDESHHLLDTLDILSNNGNTIEYTFRPQKQGQQSISGIFLEGENIGRTITGEDFFELSVDVRDCGQKSPN